MPTTPSTPVSPKNARKLTNLLIYPRFQLSLMGLNLGIMMMTLVIFWVTADNLVQTLTPTAALSGIDAQFYRRYLEYQQSQFNSAFLVAIAIGVLLSAGVTLVLSHRLAGPFIRMMNFFSSIKGGESTVPKLTFRDGDYFKELPPVVNGALSRLMGVSETETLDRPRQIQKA
jgi:hypothetical protein